VTSETYGIGSQEQTAGRVILMVSSILAALLVIAGLSYATGTGARHKAAVVAAGCEPSLFISGLPCTTRQMMASQYEAIVTPATQQLNTEIAAYAVNERRDLAAAEADLSAEVVTEQAFDNSLAATTFTPQNRAAAVALIQHATSSGTPVPLAAALLTPRVTVIAEALIQAGQARATLLAEQARSSSLTQLRSFNHRVQVASAAVEAEMKLIAKAVNLCLTGISRNIRLGLDINRTRVNRRDTPDVIRTSVLRRTTGYAAA
jgi:hypothetical protein